MNSTLRKGVVKGVCVCVCCVCLRGDGRGEVGMPWRFYERMGDGIGRGCNIIVIVGVGKGKMEKRGKCREDREDEKGMKEEETRERGRIMSGGRGDR